jgi:alpha/beta superfamily hydrolase
LCYKPPVANLQLILLSLFSFFTVHGSADELIPVEDAYEFAKHIPNHKLRVIEGANHCYTAHRKELSSAVVDFIMPNKVPENCMFYVVLFAQYVHQGI